MPALTHGPHPARVYWFRRLLVLGTAVLLVVSIARLLGGGSDASSAGDGDTAARLSADTPSTSSPAGSASSTGTPSVTPPVTPSGTATPPVTPTAAATTSAAPVLAAPVGMCQDSDVAVTPKVENGVAGRDVAVVLQLRTMTAQACTWRLSSSALSLAITSGKDAIWNSRSCPRAIPRRDVVVRKAATTEVAVTWKEAKRSDKDCSSRTEWAMPGWYHVTAAALGGEPSDLQFELTAPTAATITVTASPKQQPQNTKKPGKRASRKPSATASSG
jgi:hypothetical protein